MLCPWQQPAGADITAYTACLHPANSCATCCFTSRRLGPGKCQIACDGPKGGTVDQMLIDLLREGAALDAEIKAKNERLREIKNALAGAASFKGGSSTSYLVGASIRAKVITEVSRSWLQDRLLAIKERLPESFGTLFAPEYKPTAKRAIDQALQAGGHLADALRWAMEEKPKAPAVTFEYLEQEVVDAA